MEEQRNYDEYEGFVGEEQRILDEAKRAADAWTRALENEDDDDKWAELYTEYERAQQFLEETQAQFDIIQGDFERYTDEVNARLVQEEAELEEANFVARIDARAEVMEPLLTTLATAQSDFDSANTTYNEALADVEAGATDADGNLLPEAD